MHDKFTYYYVSILINIINILQNISKDESLLTNNKPLSSRENHIMWADQAYEDRAAPPLYRLVVCKRFSLCYLLLTQIGF